MAWGVIGLADSLGTSIQYQTDFRRAFPEDERPTLKRHHPAKLPPRNWG